MMKRKNIFAIIGSASTHSANEKVMNNFAHETKADFDVTIFKDLKGLPHFDPDLSSNNPPKEIIDFRMNIVNADGIVICTPEYVFSIPSGLKNALEWCIATVIFSEKPLGLITASSSGQKGHEELQLIMKTMMARFTEETTLLIPGVKGKIDELGRIKDNKTKEDFTKFIDAFKKLVFTPAYETK